MKSYHWLLASALLLIACSDGTGPEARPESALQFLRFPGTPPVEALQVSFWAVAGDNREGVIRYLSGAGGGEGPEFLEFRVSGNSLFRRPGGGTFQDGDSIRITITLSPDGRFLFDMQPSGLLFDPNHPARLRVRFDRLGGDLNGDGRTDAEDDRLDQRMRVWKQELAGQPWQSIGTVRVREDEIEGTITGFTGFCIAG